MTGLKAETLEAQAALGRVLLYALRHDRGAPVAYALLNRLEYLARYTPTSVCTILPELPPDDAMLAVMMHVPAAEVEDSGDNRLLWRGGLVIHEDGQVMVHT